MQRYDEMMQEVDRRVSAIDLNGKHIIHECKEIIAFLKKRFNELREFVRTTPFANNAEEILFFKYKKPMLLGHLLYFYKILRIESQRPIEVEELDAYYGKQQEELKLFFDRHIAFFQYYRSGVTHLDGYYFLRGKQDSIVDIDLCHFDDDTTFSTGYDHLVARIMAMEMLYAFLSARRTCLRKNGMEEHLEMLKSKGSYKWTGNSIELVELVYGLNEMGCINDGEAPIHELAAFAGALFGVDIRDCYSAYTDMKRRKNDSRTYFLDKMRERLNKRMEQDDEKEKKRK